MTMSTATNNQNLQTEPMFDANAVLNAENVKAQRATEKQQRAKEILDSAFPLDEGSHQDVTNYMVYYCNLVACFADGRLTSLKNPSQFVALAGHKLEPDSILLKDDQGSHLEIRLGARQGLKTLAEITDVQLESRTSLCTQSQSSHRYWISLMESGAKGDPIAHSVEKEFTSKSGDEYTLNRYC
ncbi:hypothetical protein QWZ04_02765 [Vibrio tapetis subsp. quintayensis]|uniref:hypothetical protein n=1 Tax=Vibrio tapetis TaxID=52443 RepID=UPI0025B5996A|nr:hypothetical protein [Vibrio tapetis]MDN3679249.1 hypothetical protein [Vibrio tapetis subsp. quintayensis]